MSGHSTPVSPAEVGLGASPTTSGSTKKIKRKEKKSASEKRKKKSKKPTEAEQAPEQPEEDPAQGSSDAEAFHDADRHTDADQSVELLATGPADQEHLVSVPLEDAESESDGVLSGERTPSCPSPLPEKPLNERLDELALSSPPRQGPAELDAPALKRASRHTVRTSLGKWRARGVPSSEPSPPQSPRTLEAISNANMESSALENNELHGTNVSEPSSPPPLQIVDLDAGRAVSWRDIPVAPPPLPPRDVHAVNRSSEDFSLGPSHIAESARSWRGVSLANVSAGASSLTSGLGRSLAASIAAVRRPQEQAVESVRLPRREIDEEAVAQDVFRFADAKDSLLSSASTEDLRALGVQLEAAWREKLSDSQVLRSQVEETEDVLVDLEDENDNLRDQLALLSEQIVSREETSENFQRFTVITHEKERQTWQSIVREEKDHAQITVTHARRLLCDEQAATAQLRLVLHALKAGELDVDTLETVDLGPDPEPDLAENFLDQTEQSEVAPELGFCVSDEGVGAMPLREMQDAGLVPKVEDQEVDIASRVLFDKAATDAALLRALQEENASLRGYQHAKEVRYRLLREELEGYHRQLAEAEEALSQVRKP